MSMCVHCNGSGEGMYDGTTCHYCNGKGEEPFELDNQDYIYDIRRQQRIDDELMEKCSCCKTC